MTPKEKAEKIAAIKKKIAEINNQLNEIENLIKTSTSAENQNAENK